MSASGADNARRIAEEVLRAPDPERERVLQQLCGTDKELATAVRSLLGPPRENLTAFESDLTAAPSSPPGSARQGHQHSWQTDRDEAPGSQIGAYKLLQRLGEGGFGTVYMAEQTHPVRRRVALKIIKLGMDTRQVVARFEQERQALALMNHPHIAKVYDAGATASGRPYFVMELCTGEPITDYSDRHNISIEERLALFVQVCQAIQHAHQKGLIHRDLKPSNVLVSVEDGSPSVKVIDFGIAKATASKLTEKTLFTEHRQMIGTPQYMSPEQAEGSLDIDTRTDVYALGVLLYELLSGFTPFDPQTLYSAAFAEIHRIIREVDPPKPSTRLSNHSQKVASVAAARHIEPAKLGNMLKGELDWIVMKAIEKDRQRRYETANGLGMDVQRYLAGEPVVAAPASRAYRARKFVVRHRAAVVTAGLVTVALLLGLTGTAWGLRQALVARDGEANSRREAQREAERALEAEARASARSAELQRVADFQAKMLSQIDVAAAGQKLSRDIRAKVAAALSKNNVPMEERTARLNAFEGDLVLANSTDVAAHLIDETILEPALATVNTDFGDQPLVDASLRVTLADVYFTIGLLDKALPLQTRGLEIRRKELGDDHPDTLHAMWTLGNLFHQAGKLEQAVPLLKESLDRRRRVSGAQDPATLAALHSMGGVLQDMGKLEEAGPMLREAYETSKRIRGEDDVDTLNFTTSMGLWFQATGKRTEAEPYLKTAFERHKATRGEADADTIRCANNYAVLLMGMARYPEAETILRNVVEQKRRQQGEQHAQTLLSLNNLAVAIENQGRTADAERLYRDVLETSRRTLGSDHPDSLRAIGNLANNLRAQGRFAEAEPLASESMQRHRRLRGVEHRDTLIAINVYGYVLVGNGDPAAAEVYWREAYDNGRRVLGEDHPDVVVWTANLAGLLITLGRDGEAEPLLRNAVQNSRMVNGEDHPTSVFVTGRLAKLLSDGKRFAESEPLYRQVLDCRKRTGGINSPDTLSAAFDLAMALRNQGKLVEAELTLRETLAASEQTYGVDDWRTATAAVALGRVLIMQTRFADAEKLMLDAVDQLSRSGQPEAYIFSMSLLITLYESWNKSDPGKGHDVRAAEWASKLEAFKATTQPTTTPATTKPG